MHVTLMPDDLAVLSRTVLERTGVLPAIAACVADALTQADCMGVPSHGAVRLPSYADQVAAGKVRGDVTPHVDTPYPATVRVNARCGFAYPAIAAGLDAAIPLTLRMGCVMLGIADSHHCGVAGLHVERAAREGLAALMFANAPASMASWGGNSASFGTNPIAFACPTMDEPLVIDLSLSVVARGKIATAARRGDPIPEGWAVDAQGKPTSDAAAALAGMMLPMGGAKGAALALMVELLAAALTGSNFAFEASSFLDAKGDAPRTGQLLLLFAPGALGANFPARCSTLLNHLLGQPGVRLPGMRRHEQRLRAQRDGVSIPRELYEELLLRAGTPVRSSQR